MASGLRQDVRMLISLYLISIHVNNWITSCLTTSMRINPANPKVDTWFHLNWVDADAKAMWKLPFRLSFRMPPATCHIRWPLKKEKLARFKVESYFNVLWKRFVAKSFFWMRVLQNLSWMLRQRLTWCHMEHGTREGVGVNKFCIV